MIIGSYKEKQIGEIVIGIADAQGWVHWDARGLILRKASYEEYVANVMANGGSREDASLPPTAFFYELSVD